MLHHHENMEHDGCGAHMSCGSSHFARHLRRALWISLLAAACQLMKAAARATAEQLQLDSPSRVQQRLQRLGSGAFHAPERPGWNRAGARGRVRRRRALGVSDWLSDGKRDDPSD